MSARSRAFEALSERCPYVDELVDDLTSGIKAKVTEPFREALIEAYETVKELEDKLNSMEEERDDQQNRVDEALDDLVELRREYDKLLDSQ